MAIDIESENLLHADPNTQVEAKGRTVKARKIFKPGRIYDTNNQRKPGRAPRGTKWKYQEDELNSSVRHYYLVSKTSEVPTLSQLPPVDRRGDERTDLMVSLPGLDKKRTG